MVGQKMDAFGIVNDAVGDLTGTRRSNAWIWWTAGGVAAAGGTVAAVLLTQKRSEAATSPTSGKYTLTWGVAP